jgi:PKD domain/Subtilase family
MSHLFVPSRFAHRRGSASRSRTLAVAGVAVAGVVAALALPGAAGAVGATGAGSAMSRHTTASVRPDIAVAGGHYSRLVPLCGPPKPGQFTCFAIRNAPTSVKAGTVIPDGVTRDVAFGNGAAGGYSPSDLQALYGFSRNTGGKGQTIGIVDWFDDPTALADLNHFDATYHFPAETAATFTKVNQLGKAAPLPPASGIAKDGNDTSPEISLDVQSARAVCANCKILLVEATSPSNSDLAQAENTAVRLGATEVSNSFGGSEGPKPDTAFAKAFNHKNVVITASTGDDGWYDWDFANASGGQGADVPNTPSTLSTVVAVGGTTLADTGKKPKPVRKSETVWNENGPHDAVGVPNGPEGASGGGCSTLFAAKRWQLKVAGFGKTGCGTKRLAADVSAIADPRTGFDVFDSDDHLNFFTVGGTSLSSPVVAAMWALAGGAHHVAYPSLTLYGNAKSHRTTLHDVTVGGNGFCDGSGPAACKAEFSPPQSPNTFGLGRLDCGFKPNSAVVVAANLQCEAAKGYDGASGVGTPNGLKVFSPLQPSATIEVPKLHKGHAASFAAKVADPFPGGAIATYHWTFGDGSHSKKAHPTHAYGKAKAFTVTLTVTDIYGLTHTVETKVHVKH